MKRHRVWLSGLAALAALPAAAKVDDPNDLIQGRWYATEVIIFERTEPANPGPEELVWEGGRTWPATARAFAEPKPWRIASLDPLTRACLEFPRLDVIPTTTTPAQCPEAEPSDGEAAQPRPNANPDPRTGGGSLQLGEREGSAPRMKELQLGGREGSAGSTEQFPSLPREGASQQTNRGRDALAPRMAPVPCLSTPPPDPTTPNGAAPLEPVALGPPPTVEPSLAPHPLLDLLRAAARQQAAWRRDSYRWLPKRTHELAAQARHVRNTQGLHIIWHGRWMQPVPSRSAGEPLRLVAQSTPSQGRLSGTLQVTLGRYLHFNARLWLEQAPHIEAATMPYMQLNQARTMRSGELHYLDHPRMGILVRIDPLPPSPTLVQALQAWRESMLVKTG